MHKKTVVKWIDEVEDLEEEEEETKLELSEALDCLTLDNFGTTIIAGSSSTGKTTLMKQLIKHNASLFHKIYLICSTVDLQGEYDFLPRKAIKPVSEASIKEIVEEQERNNKQRVAILMDDCIGKLKFQNSDLFDHLASSCRHYRIHQFILIQDLKKLSPTLRDNSKVLFVSRLKEHSLRACFDLSSTFSSFQEFKEFMNEACVDYQMIRFDLTGKGEVKVFQPGLHPKFKIRF